LICLIQSKIVFCFIDSTHYNSIYFILQLKFKAVSRPAKASTKNRSKTATAHGDHPTSASRCRNGPRNPSYVETAPKKVKIVQQEVRAPLDVQTQLGVRSTPLDVQTQLGVRITPLDVQTQLGVKTTSLDVKITPLDVQRSPLDVKMTPLDGKLAKSGLKHSLVKGFMITTACMSLYGFYKLLY